MPNKELKGKYVNVNYTYEPFIVDIPYVADTLILYADSTFRSSYFGEGTYDVVNTSFKSKIILNYRYEMGKGVLKADVGVDNNGNYKITLNSDENHHYKKIE